MAGGLIVLGAVSVWQLLSTTPAAGVLGLVLVLVLGLVLELVLGLVC